MRRTGSIILGIIIIVILVAGGYALFHNNSSDNSSGSSKPKSSNSSQNKTPAVNNAVLITKTDPALGQYLADPNGKPLYTYNGDTSGVSNCTGSCLSNWPPYVDKGSTTNLPSGVGTIKRSDTGEVQYTYNGMPLYFFTGDSAGQVTGDGVENFKIAKPAASSSSSSSSNTNSSSSTTSTNNSSSNNSGYPY